ncbi:leucine Rich Repeat domain-containing protein [Phlyctema vagabunda]|uniref:Leucine Rich Repeat domain-containing protein n=1 Tax=Phlyctema vagabunda TaxID=108571 RepID=A0ABR4PTH6_9HELO
MLPTRSSKINADSPRLPPSNLDRTDRASFSSVKENHSGLTQSFTDSKTSSYLRNQLEYPDEAIDDTPSPGVTTPTDESRIMLPLSQPHSALHGFVCPCEGFRGWKQISLGGKIVSKSSGDLKSLAGGWEWETRKEVLRPNVVKEERSQMGLSPFERLPMELLGAIIDQLAQDIPPNGFTARNIDLMSLLLTSRGLHAATLATLYNHITIPHSRIFRKFITHVAEHPSLGTIVRRVDFSHFNPTGAGQTARERAQTQNLTPKTLLQCLSLTPNLREFLAQEHIDDELDTAVLQKLLFGLPKLKALDFCASSSASFRTAFTTVLSSPLPDELSITRLSLHECAILPSSTFDTLLPLLPRLTHLDVAHTRITDAALMSIPHTARLTHLNLSKCGYLSGRTVVDFLSNHPAAKTLVYLNLMMDSKSREMLSSENITMLLSVLPASMRSLNLKGSKMDASHMPLLVPVTKHLEELGLGRNLQLSDISSLLLPDEDAPLATQMSWVPHTLRYLDISDLGPVDLDLSTLFSTHCHILTGFTAPLEVLELHPSVYAKLEKGGASAIKRVRWCLRDAGRRGWLVRDKADGSQQDSDDGARVWKLGATFWGMRKVPVAHAEVGGMYGLYMFKR